MTPQELAHAETMARAELERIAAIRRYGYTRREGAARLQEIRAELAHRPGKD